LILALQYPFIQAQASPTSFRYRHKFGYSWPCWNAIIFFIISFPHLKFIHEYCQHN